MRIRRTPMCKEELRATILKMKTKMAWEAARECSANLSNT